MSVQHKNTDKHTVPNIKASALLNLSLMHPVLSLVFDNNWLLTAASHAGIANLENSHTDYVQLV